MLFLKCTIMLADVLGICPLGRGIIPLTVVFAWPVHTAVISVPNILLPFDIEQLEEEQEDTMVSLSAKRLALHSNAGS